MSGIHRFLTRRDRSKGASRQAREEHLVSPALPLLRGFFVSNPSKEDSQEHEKKVKLVESHLRSLGYSTLEEAHVRHALKNTNDDVEKAISLLLLLEDSIEGIIRPYTPRTKLLGAENRQGVTCYLDSLLFAMFARLDCFEAILYKSFNDEPRRKLAILLRFWVNLLRAGKLITTDITQHIQEALAECGWEDASRLRQQDASEAFTFITGTLELPLLTLKMDIYHTGKEDVSDDHKFVNERLLEVAIPPEPTDGSTITLEDCLEAYFNNRIEVKRHLERRNTLSSRRSSDSLSMSKGFTAHVEEVETTPTQSPAQSTSPIPEKANPWPSISGAANSLGSRKPGRRDSIVRERFIPDTSEEQTGSGDSEQPRRGILRKEVMMPAWQFFSLIPWFTENTPTNDAQVAAHFSSQRPILGVCLKRYSFTPNGKAIRLNTYIDIPVEIGIPKFIQDDNMDVSGDFKLALQAVVCHRGTSVDSGHYISLVRGTSPNAAPTSSSADGAKPQGTESPKQWMRFDDLASERITLIDIETALRTESPYLLFYQILPIDQDASLANLSNKPSSLASDTTLDVEMGDVYRKLSSLAVDTDGSTTEDVTSARPSFEITSPDNTTQPLVNTERRPSVVFSDPPLTGPPRSMPSMSPRLMAMEEEGTRGSFSFSRRGSRATKSNSGSRAGSQSGENRISSTFSRFAGRLSRDKITSDGEGEVDESAFETDDAAADDIILGPARLESKDKSGKDRGSRGKAKGKSREKSKDKSRNLDRECTVM
ncbi:ubiquitin C-terminal hydrolase family protein [Penicillium brasilianum]|uniref:ubiquitinyl hydrolase 1 n=1 Tax=Penicillium brasilianum TaxID=104259 RepID=A0A0F7TUY4_PENBI